MFLVTSSILALRSRLLLGTGIKKSISCIRSIGCYKGTAVAAHISGKEKSIPNSAACLKVSRSLQKKKGLKTNESLPAQYSTPTYSMRTHAVFQRAMEEAKGSFLLVPLGHLLTPSLDLSEFGLCGHLRDAFHRDAFEKYCALGGKQRG